MSDFMTIQQAFTGFIKDPDAQPFDYGIEPRRLAIYQDLFFNNICSFLSNGFPVLESLYTPEAWRALARQFFAKHDCRSPYFVDISLEFVEYLATEHERSEQDPPFLQELAHYEWLELSVGTRKSQQVAGPWDGIAPIDTLCFSDLASLVSYTFPVHQISQDFQPQEPGETVFIVVARNSDDEVNFTLVNQVTAFLLETVQQAESIQLLQLQKDMAAALPQLTEQILHSAMQEIIVQMLKAQILLVK
ncbi:MAG: DUF2063 domain-containing protein [Paraglaciecola sp.]|nr:DUF2063 domain-containing protein [Paraglaciecola sp.]NCT47915.1 DUF2063 domain-containing protein [Paraglaciecola sp.]